MNVDEVTFFGQESLVDNAPEAPRERGVVPEQPSVCAHLLTYLTHLNSTLQ